MSVEVLKSKAEIEKARLELRRRELSFTSPRWKRLACKMGISKAVDVGDELKSWDVLKTVHFMESNISRRAPILDIGAFAFDSPFFLHNFLISNLSRLCFN